MTTKEIIDNKLVWNENDRWYRICHLCKRNILVNTKRSKHDAVKSTKRKCSCKECDSRRKSMTLKGKNNPNFKTGRWYCKCGHKKDFYAKTCKKCLNINGKNNPFFGKHHTDITKNKILDGQQKTAYKWKNHILSNGDIVNLQGFEPQTIDFLIKESGNNINNIVSSRAKIPKIHYVFNGENHQYCADFLIKSTNTLVECKSIWTWNKYFEINEAKILGSIINKYNIRVIIWDNLGKQIMKDVIYTPNNRKIELYI